MIGGRLLLLGLYSSLLWAQQASISGSVSDPQGVVPGVSITLKESGGPSRQTISGDAGTYRFDGLRPGSYELSFSRSGFETANRTITLADQAATLNVTLSIGAVSTSIDVIEVAGRATASRMPVSDLELPVQVSGISQQVLQSQGINDMVTALRNVSGATAFRAYGMYEYYTIRGFNIPYQSAVVLVDGMRLEGNRLNSQLTNVDRIEVLKGPSSILFGGQAMSAAINMIRKKPQAMPALDAFYRVGRFNAQQGGLGSTGSVLGLSRLMYRFDIGAEHSDAWRSAGSRRLNVSPAITWLITDRARVTINQAFNRDNFDGDAGVPVGVLSLPNFDLSRRFNTPSDFARFRDSQTQVLFSYNLFGNLEFRDSFLYRHTNDQYFTAESLNYRPDLMQVDRQSLYFQHHRRPKLNQADLTGHFGLGGMRHTFLAGYEYEDYYNYTDRAANRSVATTPISLLTFAETAPAINTFPLSRVDYSTNQINAIFWQDQIAVTSRLKVNVGGRFDDYRFYGHNDPYTNGVFVSRGPELQRHQTPYTYRAGVVYSVTESQQLYFSSSSSFQPVTTVPADGRELLPESGRNFEIGHRWQALRGRFTVSTAAYRLVRNNALITLPNNNFDQAGQQSAKGIDVDATGNLAHGISFIANYGYTLPRYDRYLTNNGTLDLSGFRPRFLQRHAGNVWLTKIWKSGVAASLGSRYVSSMFTSDLDTVRLGGYTTFGGALSYRRSFYEWSANAENLFNRERYFLPSQIANQVYPGPPINVFTTIRFHF